MQRGRQYRDRGMVGQYSWSADGRLLAGTCRGSGRMQYQVSVEFRGEPPTVSQLEALCTCPVGFYCKHAAALLLMAQQDALRPGAALQVAPTAVPAWRRALGEILPATNTEPERRPLALAVGRGASSRFAPDPGLNIRPMTMGARGQWIKTGASWQDVLFAYNVDLNTEHCNALRAVYQAVTGNNYITNRDALSLTNAPRAVWPALRNAVDAGVVLIPQPGPGLRVNDIELRSATIDYGVHKQPDGVQVKATIRVDDAEVAVSPSSLIGNARPHGFWYEIDQTAVLADFAEPAPTPGEIDFATDIRSVVVPESDLDEFALEFLPHIEQRRAVSLDDGVLDPPTVSGPVAVLTLSDDPYHDQGAYSWSVGYLVNDKRHLFDPNELIGATPYRNAEDEASLWKSIREPMLVLTECAGSWPTTARVEWRSRSLHRPSPQAQEAVQLLDAILAGETARVDLPEHVLRTSTPLRPVETAVISAEIVPMLDDYPQILVDNRLATTYRQLDDDPQIRFAAGDSDVGNDWFALDVTITVGDRSVPLRDVITELAAGASHIVLDDGAYFSVDTPELQRLAELITEARQLGEIEKDHVSATSMNATLWDELLELGVVDAQLKAWRTRMKKLAAATPPRRVASPRQVKATLRDYQRDGLDWLAFLSDNDLGGILADDMGLGKTLQTLALIARAVKKKPGARFLVVAPTSVVPNWVAEAQRFVPSLRVTSVVATEAKSGIPTAEAIGDAQLVVTSYTLLRLLFDDISEFQWDGALFDEAQFIKNHNGKTHQCARRLDASFKLAITGTPMENNLMELWALLSVTAPGLFPSPTAFTDYFRKPIESGQAPERMATLRRRIKPVMLRRRKDQVVLDLPAKQEQAMKLELAPRHRKIYDTRLARERQKVLGLLGDWEKNRFQVFRSLSLLRQLSLHAGLVDDTNRSVASAKVEFLMENLPELIAEGHSALVFSQFTAFLAIVRAHLDDAGIAYSYLDGSMTAPQRATAVNEFTSGTTQVFLISLKAGGFGLNLTEADYCFVCDPWWNPAAEAQAVDRAHRIGQQRPVTVYRLVSADTIEERVVGLQDRKRALFDAAIDEGELFGTAITASDIREMIG
ncbi:SNF2-related protein [Gordonia sp. DT219]|uniref:DEAD/DEAH box helicase n=1 Tax=Gordonia sp. DT219 TaxID=3416658 RepID=UPI003CF66D64